MRTLLIDTASPACSVALFEDGVMLGAYHEVIGRGHAERLVSQVAMLPDRGKADHIWVDIGPGSFTGIRVGLSAAKALAFAWQCPCIGFSQMAFLAAMALKESPDSSGVDVVINGGHGELFVQSYDSSLNPSSELASVTPDLARNLLQHELIVGDTVGEAFAASVSGAHFLTGTCDMRLWSNKLNIPQLNTSPLYVRAADAKLPVEKRK